MSEFIVGLIHAALFRHLMIKGRDAADALRLASDLIFLIFLTFLDILFDQNPQRIAMSLFQKKAAASFFLSFTFDP